MDKLQFGHSPPKVVKNMSRAVPKSQMFKVSPALIFLNNYVVAARVKFLANRKS